jgi:hypothetical protein
MITIVNEVFFLDLEGNVKSLKGEFDVIWSGSRGKNNQGKLLSPQVMNQIRNQRERIGSLKSFMLDHALKSDEVFWNDENTVHKVSPDTVEDYIVELDNYPIAQYIEGEGLKDRLVTVRAEYISKTDSVEVKFFENGAEVFSNVSDRNRAKEIFLSYFWGEFEASHDRYIESFYG